LGKEELLYFL